MAGVSRPDEGAASDSIRFHPALGAGVLRLSDIAVGRYNNFNLIRLIAALSVIFSHSVAALGLPPEREVFFGRVGFSLAEMAVDVFFVTSGFLVTGSLIGRGSLNAFLWARALRIYPALWVMLVVTVFGLAPALTSLPLADYFAAPRTREYFIKCATLIWGLRYSLPGVFETLPLKGEFNGSLWTLPIEVRLYLNLAAAWFVLALLPAFRVRALKLALLFAAAAWFVFILRIKFTGGANGPDIRVFMFLYGSALYLWRDRIPIGWAGLVALPAALLAASVDKTVFFVVYSLCLAPLVMHLAYLPGGAIRRFNEWGDLSYGVYIWAFPIQQTLALAFPGLSLWGMVVLSSALSLAVAHLSWRLIEKRALAMKGDCAVATASGASALGGYFVRGSFAKALMPGPGATRQRDSITRRNRSR